MRSERQIAGEAVRLLEMSLDVSKVLGPDAFSPQEADAILEIAYLTGVANGSLSRDELRSFRRLAHTLAEQTDRAPEGTPSRRPDGELEAEVREPGKVVPTFLVSSDGTVTPLEDLLDRYESATTGVDTSTRLAGLAKTLRRDHARRAAYRVAYALSISDLESNEDEEELESDLATALGLHEEIGALRNEVLGAVDSES